MGRLFEIVEEYRSRYSPHEPTYSKVAEQVGVSRQTLLNWREPTKLIDKEHLLALEELTGVPYQRLLDALLEDIGYLRKDQPVLRAARKNTRRPPQGPRVQGPD